MLTLHTVTENSRNILKWILVVGGMSLFLYFVTTFIVSFYKQLHPAKPAGPTMTYGKLSTIPFPKNTITIPFKYTTDTLSGDLGVFPDRLNIYKLTQYKPTLLSLDNAKTKAAILGFTQPDGSVLPEQPVSESEYAWFDQGPLSKHLVMDIASFNFKLSSTYLTSTNSALLNAKNLPDEKGAIDFTIAQLSAMSVLPSDIDSTKTHTELIKLQNGTATQAQSIMDANIVHLNLYQQDIDKLPIMYANPPYSSMNFLVGSGDTQAQFVDATFFHYQPTKDSATYPIKTPDVAYADLTNGKAFIASYTGTGEAVTIKKDYLAYYLSDTTDTYLMPIVVFEGDNGFMAYVSAVQDAQVTESP